MTAISRAAATARPRAPACAASELIGRAGARVPSSARPALTCERTSVTASSAPARQIAQATSSATDSACVYASGVNRPPISWAMIAPMSAIPIVPPTCRDELRTAEADACLVARHAAEGGRGRRRHHRRHAEAAEQHPRYERPVALAHAEPGEVQELRRDERHPHGHQGAGPEPVREASGQRRDEHHEQRHGQECRAGLDGRVAEHVLHVQREEEEDPEHRERHEQHHDVRAGECAASEQREVEHREALSLFEQDERRQRDRGAREGADDERRRPAVAVALDECEGECEQADSRGDQPRHVGPLLA